MSSATSSLKYGASLCRGPMRKRPTMRSPDRTRTSCATGTAGAARAEVHRGFRAEDLLEAGLRPIDEERLGGRGSQRAEKMLDRFDGRVAASEPAAIEDGADAGVNPRQRDDHRQQHDRVNPREPPTSSRNGSSTGKTTANQAVSAATERRIAAPRLTNRSKNSNGLSW